MPSNDYVLTLLNIEAVIGSEDDEFSMEEHKQILRDIRNMLSELSTTESYEAESSDFIKYFEKLNTHELREQLKHCARLTFENAVHDSQRVVAIILVILSHYLRSLEAVGINHPGFDIYAAHWLYANRDGWSFCDFKRHNDIYERLTARYPTPDVPLIHEGRTYLPVDWEKVHEIVKLKIANGEFFLKVPEGMEAANAHA